MTREEVIRILDPETSRDALWIYEDKEDRLEAVNEACRMAIAALRAQQAPAKLDRSRWEGCDSCENQKIREIMVKHKRKYCSLCGKPLTEEAWAETARRIGGNDGTTD